MALPKKEGRKGVRVFFATNSTAIVKRTEKSWNLSKSIFAEWMTIIYVKRMYIDNFTERHTIDSRMWKSKANTCHKRNNQLLYRVPSNNRRNKLTTLLYSEVIRPKP